MDGQLLNIFADFVRGIWELLKADSVFFPFVAVSIALGLSIAELLQKYPDRTARELFLSSTFLAFLGVNAIVCLVVYLLLPNIADLFAASDGKSADWVSHLKTDGWLRALVAGFGYLTVARAKIIEFKGPGGASIPIGFELLYNAFTNWLISKH